MTANELTDGTMKNWVWGVCLVGTALTAGFLALRTDSVRLFGSPTEISLAYKACILLGGVVAGALWGLLPRSCASKYGRRVWGVVALGLLAGAILGYVLQNWLVTSSLEDLVFPVTKAAWKDLVHDVRGVILFVMLLPLTLTIDVMLLMPVMIAAPFIPFVVLVWGPLVGSLTGALVGRLGLRVFTRRAAD